VTRPAVRLLIAAQAALFVLPTSPHAASVLPLPAVDTPTGGGGTVVLEPVKQHAGPTRRLVFSCVTPGLVTFSDRPCGPVPEVRELKLDQPVPAAAGASPEVGKVVAQTPTNHRKTTERDNAGPAAAEAERVMTCQKLQAALDSVDSRMRAGYSAREAGGLWERWRDAKARLRAANC
jgi:hypothetical protein